MTTILGCGCVAIYTVGIIKSPRPQKSSYMLMLISSLLPWGSCYLSSINMNVLGLDYYPILMTLTGVLYVMGLFRYNIFETIPIATEIVFKQSQDGIALIDCIGRILDANSAFLKMYPDVFTPPKQNFKDFIARHSELNGLAAEKNELQYRLKDSGQYFTAARTDIISDTGLSGGAILTIRDITLNVENEKRLKQIATNAVLEAETHELSFLQAQINPHFLNNTLHVISSMITRRPESAKELIVYLSEYLVNCYASTNKTPKALLEDELQTVETYIKIEKARFGERLNYSVLCDKIPHIYIPRLVLQPLVENAVQHGIMKKLQGGNVTISINTTDDAVFFEVQDDGVGIEPERLETLLKTRPQGRSIALVNINNRLLKHYGQGLSIKSILGAGTTVSFSVPLDLGPVKNNTEPYKEEQYV